MPGDSSAVSVGSCRRADRRPDRRHELESSAEYYRLMNELVREQMGGLHSARCLLCSLDFAEIEQLQATGAWKEAENLLIAAGQSLEHAGADFLVLCTNTMHKVAEGLEAGVPYPSSTSPTS